MVGVLPRSRPASRAIWSTWSPAARCRLGASREELADLADQVGVDRLGVRDAGEADVGGHHGGAVPGGDREVVRVGEPADVVADDRAGPAGGVEHRRPPRVDREWDGHAGVEGLDGRDGAVELLGFAHVGSRAGLHAADVEHVGAVDHELVGAGQQGVERVGGAPVIERVGSAVQDAHDERPATQVVELVPETERERHVVGAYASPRRIRPDVGAVGHPVGGGGAVVSGAGAVVVVVVVIVAVLVGTRTCSPSRSLAARLSRSRSAAGSAPPTASTASMTRDPTGSSMTPGRVTAPATCTITWGAGVLDAAGVGVDPDRPSASWEISVTMMMTTTAASATFASVPSPGGRRPVGRRWWGGRSGPQNWGSGGSWSAPGGALGRRESSGSNTATSGDEW